MRRTASRLGRGIATSWWLLPALAGAVLLWPSLVGERILIPADVLFTALPWSELPGAERGPDNALLRDLIDTYHPEQATIWERILGPGDPSWLEGSGIGGPGWWFVGNGALSPFVAPWYLLDMPIRGVALGAFMRIAVAGAGIGMVVRGYGGTRVAAALAGTCFALSGFMIGWLGWPQSGVGAMVGWVWWATRRAAGPDAPWWAVPAVAGSVAVAWLAGFPSVAALLVASAVLLAAAESGLRPRHLPQLRPLGRLGGRDALSGAGRAWAGVAAGSGLAAFQLLPSLAFLGAVDLSSREEAWRATLPVSLLLRWLAPDVYGDGQGVPYWGPTNLVEGAASVGVAAIVLAVAAVVLRGLDRPVRQMGAVAVASGALVYGLPPLSRLLGFLPGLGTNPPARAVVFTGAAVCVLAGLGLDTVRGLGTRADGHRGWSVRRRAAALGGAVVVGAAAVLVIARPDRALQVGADAQLVGPVARQAAEALAWRALGVALLLLTVVAVALWLRRRTHGVLAGVLTIAVAVVAIGEPLVAAAGWNAQRPEEELYPQTAELDAIAAAAPPPERVAGTQGVLLPMTDLRYPFDDARGRRFLTRGQRALIKAAGGRYPSPTRWELSFDPGAWTAALAALGVTTIVLPPAAPTAPLVHIPSGIDEVGPLTSGAPVEVAVEQGGDARPARAIVVRADTQQRDVEGRLVVTVGVGAHAVLGSVRVDGLRHGQLVEVPLDRPARMDPRTPVTIVGTTEDAHRAVSLFGDGGVVDATAVVEDGWPATDVGHVRIAEVPAAIPWASLVDTVAPWPAEEIPGRIARHGRSGAVVRATPEAAEALQAQAGGGLEMTTDGGAADVLAGAGIPALHADGRRITATVESRDGAVLRVLEPEVPGWVATVDGAPVDVIGVDAAFIGVGVPAGRHDVVLRWSPPWLTAGWVVTATAAALLLAWTVFARLRRDPDGGGAGPHDAPGAGGRSRRHHRADADELLDVVDQVSPGARACAPARRGRDAGSRRRRGSR